MTSSPAPRLVYRWTVADPPRRPAGAASGPTSPAAFPRHQSGHQVGARCPCRRDHRTRGGGCRHGLRQRRQHGTEPAFALGVEEELLLVGPDNDLADRSAQVVRDVHPDEGGVDRELFKSMVESRLEISANAGEAIAALREVRRELAESGARLMGWAFIPRPAGGGGRPPNTALLANRGLAAGRAPHPHLRPAHPRRDARRGNGGPHTTESARTCRC